jgi:hypothetical protein
VAVSPCDTLVYVRLQQSNALVATQKRGTHKGSHRLPFLKSAIHDTRCNVPHMSWRGTVTGRFTGQHSSSWSAISRSDHRVLLAMIVKRTLAIPLYPGRADDPA